MKEHYVVFTDGASRGNPGAGGYGAVIVSLVSKEVWEFGDREDGTTNNRMEMSAIVRALHEIENINPAGDYEVTIHTDSKYVMKGATLWIFGWQKNNWQTKNKTDVLNRDLWENLAQLIEGKKIEWKHVPGHVGIPGNERVDEIGTKLADEEPVDLYQGSLDGYPIQNILETDFDESELEKKKKKTGKAYSYVSLVGGEVKAHSDWNSCKIRVEGKKAKFKKVFSEEEEKALIDEWSR
jgi:ribonuclease HI